jgi:hypothetical protein
MLNEKLQLLNKNFLQENKHKNEKKINKQNKKTQVHKIE